MVSCGGSTRKEDASEAKENDARYPRAYSGDEVKPLLEKYKSTVTNKCGILIKTNPSNCKL